MNVDNQRTNTASKWRPLFRASHHSRTTFSLTASRKRTVLVVNDVGIRFEGKFRDPQELQSTARKLFIDDALIKNANPKFPHDGCLNGFRRLAPHHDIGSVALFPDI